MDDRRITRRSALGLMALGAMWVSTGCGSDSKADAGPSPAPTATAAAGDDPGVPSVERGAFPVRIVHTWNQAGTVIPSEPKRIVVLGMREQDTITALGVHPLTIRNYFGAQTPWTSFPWLTDFQRNGNYTVIYTPTRDSKTGKLSGVDQGPILANGFAQASNTPERKEVFDYDAIKALNPDLILAVFAGVVLEDYQKLSAIAPTVTMVSSDSKDYFSSWQEEALALGKILGRPKYAQNKVEEIEQMFLDQVTAHPELRGATVALAAPGPNGQIRIINPYAEMARFFTALHMQFPGRIESATSYSGVSRKMYGIETNVGNLGFLDGVDVLAWIVGHDGQDAMAKVKATSAYQNMRVVRSNKVLELGPDEAEAIYYSSLTSLPWAISKIVPQIVGLLGDKKARDAIADQQAQKNADAQGDLNINYDPSHSPTPDPTTDPNATSSPQPGSPDPSGAGSPTPTSSP